MSDRTTAENAETWKRIISLLVADDSRRFVFTTKCWMLLPLSKRISVCFSWNNGEIRITAKQAKQYNNSIINLYNFFHSRIQKFNISIVCVQSIMSHFAWVRKSYRLWLVSFFARRLLSGEREARNYHATIIAIICICLMKNTKQQSKEEWTKNDAERRQIGRFKGKKKQKKNYYQIWHEKASLLLDYTDILVLLLLLYSYYNHFQLIQQLNNNFLLCFLFFLCFSRSKNRKLIETTTMTATSTSISIELALV